MQDALLGHRIQFAFTVSFHYLFPQLTMGLALIIVLFKVAGLKTGDERYQECARFWGLFLFGEKRLGLKGHLAATVALFAGSWLSGYFIIVANAFMQHPVGYAVMPDGSLALISFWRFVFNPWAHLAIRP